MAQSDILTIIGSWVAYFIQIASEYYILKLLGAAATIGLPIWLSKKDRWSLPKIIFAGIVIFGLAMIIHDHLISWASSHGGKKTEDAVRELLDKEGFATKPEPAQQDEVFRFIVTSKPQQIDFIVRQIKGAPKTLVLFTIVTPKPEVLASLSDRERRLLYLDIRQALLVHGILFSLTDQGFLLQENIPIEAMLARQEFQSKLTRFTYAKLLVDILLEKAIAQHLIPQDAIKS